MVRRKRKKVSFWATKPVKTKVSFVTKSGKRVTFYAKVPKKVKVTFYAKRKMRRR